MAGRGQRSHILLPQGHTALLLRFAHDRLQGRLARADVAGRGQVIRARVERPVHGAALQPYAGHACLRLKRP